MVTMSRTEATVFRETDAIIGESIWWNAEANAIEWCDITNGLMHRSPIDGPVDGSADRVLEFPPPLGAFQPRRGGGFIGAGENFVFVCDEDGNDLQTIATVEHGHFGIRFNEGKCDPFGNFVVGSMDVTGENPECAIYVVDPDGRVRPLVGGITVSNGFEWSDDGLRMYFTDTTAETIYAGDYDGAELRNIEPFVVGQQSDGLARDVDGGFWNGINSEGLVVRWDAGGARTHEFPIPAGHTTSVAFGGPALSTLFIATAREKLTEEQLDQFPLTGSIFQLETSTRGYPVHSFGTPASAEEHH
jgi:sugar lactone lactonase YvrE